MNFDGYYPDGWSIIKLNDNDYRVYAGFRGGYIESDKWRVNSGITRAGLTKEGYIVEGDSGTAYKLDLDLHDNFTMYLAGTLQDICRVNNATVLSEEEAMDYLNGLVLKSGNGG